jgi:hypothetical protein
MRTLEEIVGFIRKRFVQNATLRQAYGLTLSAEFDEQFSKASIEAQLTYLVALAVYDHEYLIEERMAEIEAKIASRIPFSPQWYVQKAMEFQAGDTVTFLEAGNQFGYATIDESKCIVRHVAVREELSGISTILYIYAAKTGRAPLTHEEQMALSGYLGAIGAAGTYIQVVSLPADKLHFTLTVNYDPQVLNMYGNQISGGGKPVEKAVGNYLESIPYTGAFRVSACMESIRQAAGVRDVAIDGIYLNDATEPVTNKVFQSDSGFFEAGAFTVAYIPDFYD